MLVEPVVVEVDLRVARDHAAVLGEHERVDLDEVRAVVHEQRVQRAEHRRERLAKSLGKLRVEREPAADERGVAARGIDPVFLDRVGIVLGDLFDVHAALRGDEHDGLLRRAVDRDRHVRLARDVDFLLDQQRLHFFAVGVLDRLEHLADQLARERLALLRVVGELDAAGLAAAAHHHLALEHPRAGMLGDERLHVVRGRGEDAVGRRNPDAPEQVLALVLHQLHGAAERSARREDAPGRQWSQRAEAHRPGCGESGFLRRDRLMRSLLAFAAAAAFIAPLAASAADAPAPTKVLRHLVYDVTLQRANDARGENVGLQRRLRRGHRRRRERQRRRAAAAARAST